MTPNEFLEIIKTFIAFCLRHPYLSVPFAFLLIIFFVAETFEKAKSLLDFSQKILNTGTKTQRRMLWTALASMIGLAIASPFLAALISPIRPVILPMHKRILAKSFVTSWEYDDISHENVSYQIRVENSLENSTQMYFSVAPYFIVPDRGELAIRVRATAPNWSSEFSEAQNIQVYSDSIDRLRATKRLGVAVHDDNSEGLFCFLNRRTGMYDGFDVEFAELIRKNLQSRLDLKNLQLDWHYEKFPKIIFIPNEFDVDMSIASISINVERQKKVLFSQPYSQTEIAIVQEAAKAGSGGDIGPKDLDGLRIGVHFGTTAIDFMNEIKLKGATNMQIEIEQNNEELFALLINRRIDGIAYDYVRTIAESVKNPNWIVRRFDKSKTNVQPENYGIAFSLGNERLRDEVDKILIQNAVSINNMLNARINALKFHTT